MCLDHVDEGVDGKEDGEEHAAGDEGEEDHEDWFNHGGDGADFFVHFPFKDFGGFAEHGVHLAGLFADGDHLGDDGQDVILDFEGFGEGFAAFDEFAGFFKAFGDDDVVDGAGGDFQHIKDWHAGFQEDLGGAGETRHVEAAEKAFEDGDVEGEGVFEANAGFGVEELAEKKEGDDGGDTERPPPLDDEAGNANHDFGD